MATPETDLAPEEEAAEKQKLSLQLKVDSPSACKRHVTVTIPRADIERYFTEAFDDLVPKAEVPGFRAGRAPRKLVESKFREQMSQQVKGSLLMDSVSQASDECKFSAISEPDFDFEAIELPAEGPMTFEFNIEVRPEFELPEWKGLKLERQVHDYTDEEIDRHLQTLLARYGRLTNKEGAVEAGDHVTLNITFKDGEQVVSQVEHQTVAVKPTLSFSDGNLAGFDQLVVGAAAGDRRTARITIGNEAEKEELRGREVEAELEIVSVKRLELPELTPGFLDRIGGFEDEDELRDAVAQELERQLAYYQQQRIRQQVAAQLTQGANWELPADLLRRQARRELDRAVLELRRNGFSDDVIRRHANQLRQNSQATTERALKEHFIFERIAEDQKFEAEAADYDAEIRLIALQSNDSARRVRARLEKRGQMDALRNQIIERKVIDLITSEAEFRDVPFEPRKDEDSTVAIDHAISGHSDEGEIPEAKYGGDTEDLRNPAERG